MSDPKFKVGDKVRFLEREHVEVQSTIQAQIDLKTAVFDVVKYTPGSNGFPHKYHLSHPLLRQLPGIGWWETRFELTVEGVITRPPAGKAPCDCPWVDVLRYGCRRGHA